MARYKGTAADDRLDGGGADDRVAGLGGDDRLVGNLGNDTLAGGDGRDLLIGDVADDWSSAGNDVLSGGTGDDLLSGGAGDDVLSGGSGDDLLFGGTVYGARFDGTAFVTQLFTNKSGSDVIDGGAGYDTAYLALDDTDGVSVDLSDPTLVAAITSSGSWIGSVTGVEAAVVYGGIGTDAVVGGTGDDVLFGNGGDDRLDGSSGKDRLEGGDGDDQLRGGAGDDHLVGGAGDDDLDGGDGKDEAVYSYSGATLDLSFDLNGRRAEQSGDGRDRLTSIETLYSSNFSGGATTVHGSAEAEMLVISGFGNLTVDAGAGDDSVYSVSSGGMAERVRLSGGDGADRLSVSIQPDGARDVALDGGAGADELLAYGIGDFTLSGGAGDDDILVQANGSTSHVSLGSGRDTLRFAATDLVTTTAITVDDFATGRNGDVIALNGLLGTFTNFDLFTSNPFLDGHLRLISSGTNTVLEVDRDGGGDAWSTIVTFTGAHVTDFVLENVDGYALVPGYVQSGTDRHERLVGADGDDILSGGGGMDELSGFDGQDILYGDVEGPSPGTGGDDGLFGGNGADILIGGEGNDRLSGGAGDDVLIGGVATAASFLRIFGADYVENTTIDAGGDQIEGGTGTDRAVLAYARADGIELSVADPDVRSDIRAGGVAIGSVRNVEAFTIYTSAGTGNDRIVTGGGDDAVYTGDGDDRVETGAGSDTINGGLGNDWLDGGEGRDTVRYVSLPGVLTVDLARQGRAQDTGAGGVDTLTGIEAVYVRSLGTDATLTGDAGDNSFYVDRYVGSGRVGDLVLSGGAGRDVITVNSLVPVGRGNHVLSIDSGAGDDYVNVGYDPGRPAGREILTVLAGDGADTVILDEQGSATIDLGAGADQLRMDLPTGQSRVTLGADRDVVTLTAAASAEVTRDAVHFGDFATGAGGDVLVLGEWLSSGTLIGYTAGIDPFAAGYLALRQRGNDTQLLVDRDGGGNGFSVLMTFEHTSARSFVSDNFNGLLPASTFAVEPSGLGDGAHVREAIAATHISHLATEFAALP